jgi:hypothetical protein
MPKTPTNKELLSMVDTGKLGKGAKIKVKKTPKKKPYPKKKVKKKKR